MMEQQLNSLIVIVNYMKKLNQNVLADLMIFHHTSNTLSLHFFLIVRKVNGNYALDNIGPPAIMVDNWEGLGRQKPSIFADF